MFNSSFTRHLLSFEFTVKLIYSLRYHLFTHIARIWIYPLLLASFKNKYNSSALAQFHMGIGQLNDSKSAQLTYMRQPLVPLQFLERGARESSSSCSCVVDNFISSKRIRTRCACKVDQIRCPKQDQRLPFHHQCRHLGSVLSFTFPLLIGAYERHREPGCWLGDLLLLPFGNNNKEFLSTPSQSAKLVQRRKPI